MLQKGRDFVNSEMGFWVAVVMGLMIVMFTGIKVGIL